MVNRKTQEEWEKEYKGLTGDEYTFLEPYQKSSAKIACRHNKCGYEWKVTPHHFLHGVRCPKCNSGNKLSNEKWLAKVKELKGDEFTFLDEYVDNNTELTCLHNVCGNKFKITPRNFKSKKRKYKCPYCKKPGNYKEIEVYQKKLEEAFDKSYIVLEKIEGDRAKLKIEHKPCGSITEIRSDRIGEWRGCPNCTIDKSKQNGGKRTRKTNEEWLQEVYNMVGDEYTFLEPYVNVKTPMLVRHNKCGYEWKTQVRSFQRGSRCPQCRSKSRMKTNEEFLKEVYDLVGDEYTFLEKYKGARAPIKYRHNVCGNVYKRKPNHFLTSGGICPECHGGGKDITTEKFKERLEKARGDEYTLLGEYKTSHDKILFRHNVCGKEFEMVPNHMLGGTGCPHCFGKFRKTTEQYKDEVEALYGDEYTVLGEYVNSITSILMKHNTCGYEWETSPSNFINGGTQCPRCARRGKSRGEALIEDYLIKHNIDYEPQKTFDDCIGNAEPLPFDFYIPSANMAIEYDGEQHFKSVEYWGGDKKFEERINYDKIKNQYCDDNDIFLVRIPYTITGEGLTKMLDGAIKPIIDDGGSSKMKAIFFAAPYKY